MLETITPSLRCRYGAFVLAGPKGCNMRLKKLRSAGEGAWATALYTANSIMTRAHFMCACFSKRCKTCQTLYQSPMTRAWAIGLFLILAAPLALAKSKKCTVRVHAQGNENDGSVVTTP